jgi:REP element-mobilizing transposase RayT
MPQASWFSHEDYKHYRNQASSGPVFVTTTVLKYIPVFNNKACADLMTASLLDDCLAYKVKLWSFVVMPHHVHFLAALPEKRTISSLMNRIKSNAGRRLSRVFSDDHRALLKTCQGPNRRTIWQRGFRSFPIEDSDAFATKIQYIYMNPMKAALCKLPEDYRWSSTPLQGEGLVTWETGLRIDRGLINRFASDELLRLGRNPREGRM